MSDTTSSTIEAHPNGAQTIRLRQGKSGFFALGERADSTPTARIEAPEPIVDDLRTRLVRALATCGGVPINARALVQTVGLTEGEVVAAVAELVRDSEAWVVAGAGWRGPVSESEIVARALARADRGQPGENPIDALAASLSADEACTSDDLAAAAGLNLAVASDLLMMMHSIGVVRHPMEIYTRGRNGRFAIGWMRVVSPEGAR